MAALDSSVVVIGGGMGGYSVAKELRSRGHSGAITIIDPEGIPYDRPPLSKDYLLGKRSAEDIQFSPASWYEENNITLVTGTAQALDVQAKTVTLTDGETLAGDVIVIVTGGRARQLNIDGSDSPRVHTLRNRADADSLREVIAGGNTRVAIIGGGLIGAEMASSVLPFGAQVTLIDPSDVPLVPAVGVELATRLHHMHAEKGVTVVKGLSQAIIEKGDCASIVLADESEIDAEVILVGIGIEPNLEFAEVVGLETDNGIIVDASQQTLVEGIYAIGDVARVRAADGTLKCRAEHWENAMNAGTTAAAAIVGQELPKHGAHWFWSDRHGVHVEGVGRVFGEGTKIHREEDGVITTTFMLNDDGTMAGCAAIDGGLTVRAARRIIDRGIIIKPEKLSDPSIPLKKLAR